MQAFFYFFYVAPVMFFYIAAVCCGNGVCGGGWGVGSEVDGRGCGFEVGSGLRSNCAAAVRLPNRVY